MPPGGGRPGDCGLCPGEGDGRHRHDPLLPGAPDEAGVRQRPCGEARRLFEFDRAPGEWVALRGRQNKGTAKAARFRATCSPGLAVFGLCGGWGVLLA